MAFQRTIRTNYKQVSLNTGMTGTTYLTEASSIGIDPELAAWPVEVIVDRDGCAVTFKKLGDIDNHGDFGGRIFKADNGMTLTVFND